MLSFELVSLWRIEHGEARGDSGRCEDAVLSTLGKEGVAYMRVLAIREGTPSSSSLMLISGVLCF